MGRHLRRIMPMGAGCMHGVSVAMGQQQDVAGFDMQTNKAGPVELHTALGDDVEMRPSGRLSVVRRRPWTAEPAEILQFGPHAQQRRKPT